jgi:hypothetical protein
MSHQLRHCVSIVVETWTDNIDRICLNEQWLPKAERRQRKPV